MSRQRHDPHPKTPPTPAPNPSPPPMTGLYVAVQGCGHGVLHSIYASATLAAKRAGWPTIDLLIIGGDFQSLRNADDLAGTSIPPKYRSMQDFHEYYSGKRVAPYLTIFVGGNHEASNYLSELHYGGWVAPGIYYMGAANVVDVGGVRIAGMSGIWKGHDFRKPHYERLPYNSQDVRSVYHTRELDVRKLLTLRKQVDVGVSHDWPKGVERFGDSGRLWKKKPYLKQDAQDQRLGSVAARMVLDRLRPTWWFSAHLHVKHAAVVRHQDTGEVALALVNGSATKNEDEIDLSGDDTAVVIDGTAAEPAKNEDEIDLDMDDDDDNTAPTVSKLEGANGAPEPVTEDTTPAKSEVPESLRAQLPEAFTRQKTPPPASLPFPDTITNKETNFLALDKCLPKRDFLQLQLLTPTGGSTDSIQRPVKLRYDKEWLAITRVFASELTFGDVAADVPKNQGEAHYRPLIEAEEAWVEKHIVEAGNMDVPENFQITAPVYDGQGIAHVKMPREYTNNQTKQFCDMLEIANPFDATEEERDVRMQKGPRPSGDGHDDEGRAGGGGFGRGGHRGRGGRGRGRGNRGGRR